MYKPRQIEVEQRYDKPLPKVLTQLLNELGSKAAVADVLGVAPSTIGVWVKEYGIMPVTVWQHQGESND